MIILNLFLLLINLFLIYKAKNIKTQRINQINRIQTIINQKQQKINLYQNRITQQKQKIDNLLNKSFELDQKLQQKQNNLNHYYQNLKQQINQSYEAYINTIDQCYEVKEKDFISKIKKIKLEQKEVENKLTQIKNIYQAAAAARIKEQEEQEKRKFYQLQIPNKQIADIMALNTWKQDLNDSSIVSKIIWSSYIMKPTNDLCNRVVGSNGPACGIYKITNNSSGDVYIGQSVNISDRFKQHIKCGLGIDASPTNKLYNNMQEYGVWNFTFEILQICSRDKLNEKEKFWIEMYQSNKNGLNSTKGGA